MQVTLTKREFDTVLAALRYWQRAVHNDSIPTGIPPAGVIAQDYWNIADGDHGKPLSEFEVDCLCEQINTETPQTILSAKEE